MKRFEALSIILNSLESNDAAIFTTGMISREAFAAKDRKNNFYMIGSMGLCSSFSLGLAQNLNNRIFAFDGDGSLLMDLGNMANIGTLKPKNFFHIILDNGCYQSTGCQATISEHIDFSKIAKSCGYTHTFQADSVNKVKILIKKALKLKGPVFFHIKVSQESEEAIARVNLTPEEIKNRFINAIT